MVTDALQPSVIWTVGHSSRTWPEFLALLTPWSIELIADVRRFAGSRKHPQFGMDRLPQGLAADGMGYLPIAELGGRRTPRADSTNTIWRNTAFRAYADHMQTDEYRRGREQLLAAAAARRTAILCSEAVWWRCHRSMIADDLKTAGIQVLHIMGPGKVVEHPYTAAASVRDGRLVYGPAPDQAT